MWYQLICLLLQDVLCLDKFIFFGFMTVNFSSVFNARLTQSAFNVICYQHRCSHWGSSVKKAFLKHFEKFTGKHLYQSLFFNKVADLRLWHSVFLFILLNLGTPFFTEHLQVATFVCIKSVFRDPSLDFRS